MTAADKSSGRQPAGSYATDASAEEALAGSYLRLSSLPAAYDPFSPENQRRLTSEAAARNGERIPPEFEFKDLDITARRDVHRPDFEKAIQTLLDGRIRTLYVAKLDRLTRRGMAHIGTILDQLEKAGGRIVFIADGLDTSKPGSRQIIAILAEQARAESDNISWRIGQWHAHNRRVGIWNKRRPFGYLVKERKLVPHPEEAPVVRWMVDEFLAGGSLRGIAQQLNQKGVKPPRMAIWYEEAKAKGHRVKEPKTTTWNWVSVKSILTQPAVAALVSHKGHPVYDEHGDLVFAGEGIATVAERARILAELERRGTTVRESRNAARVGKRTGAGRPPKHLLVGMVRCGLCGFSGGYHSPQPGKGRQKCFCTNRQRGNSCPAARIPAEYLEEEVARRFRRKLAALEPGDPLLDAVAERWLAYSLPAEEAERRVLEQAKTDLETRVADLYAARYQRNEFQTAAEIGIYESMMQRLREQRDAADDALTRLGPRPTVDIGVLLDTELSEAGWSVLPISRQRDLLKLAIREVLLLDQDLPSDQQFTIWWHGEEHPVHTKMTK